MSNFYSESISDCKSRRQCSPEQVFFVKKICASSNSQLWNHYSWKLFTLLLLLHVKWIVRGSKQNKRVLLHSHNTLNCRTLTCFYSLKMSIIQLMCEIQVKGTSMPITAVMCIAVCFLGAEQGALTNVIYKLCTALGIYPFNPCWWACSHGIWKWIIFVIWQTIQSICYLTMWLDFSALWMKHPVTAR